MVIASKFSGLFPAPAGEENKKILLAIYPDCL